MLYVPTEHVEQAKDELLPVNGLYVPPGQAEHADNELPPVDGLYVPAGQAVQLGGKPYLPAEQPTH